MTDRLWLADPWRSRLTQHGLSTVDAFLHWTEGRRVSWRENGLETIRIELRTAADPLLVGYLKRYVRSQGHWSYFRHAGRLRREAAALRWLQERSLNVPPLLAWGVRSRWGVVTASFLLTEAVEGAETLEALWRHAAPAPAIRRRMLALLARLIGRLHQAGFFHGNLYARNLLWRPVSNEWFLIDFPASRWQSIAPMKIYYAVRDLSSLMKDLRRTVPRPDRFRFLRDYVAARWPVLAPQTADRTTRRLWQRVHRHLAWRQWRQSLRKGARGPGPG
jgi:tRNA A-37 threonylcarbamoyl transferase component Bud32